MGRETLRPLAEAHAEAMLAATPREIAQSIRSLIAPVDDLALDRGFADFWAEAMPRVFAQGVEGWLDDDEAFVEPFGFDVAAITRPVLVWHGHHDRFVPPSHGRWLGARIPGAEVRLTADDGHLTLSVDRIPAVHEWLLARF
jgi:pimeloyl-ACP methyl ester carboxylesterase